jgi:hypothetical protein
LRSELDQNVETGGGDGRDKSLAALTEEYLKESEKLFELTSAMVRARQELS